MDSLRRNYFVKRELETNCATTKMTFNGIRAFSPEWQSQSNDC